MSTLDKVDRRIQERLLRERRINRDEVEKSVGETADAAGNLRVPDDAELAAFGEELEREKEIRAGRIECALERAVAPPPPPPEPVQELDEDEI